MTLTVELDKTYCCCEESYRRRFDLIISNVLNIFNRFNQNLGT